MLLKSALLVSDNIIENSNLKLEYSNFLNATSIISCDVYFYCSNLHITDTTRSMLGFNVKYAGYALFGNVFKTYRGKYNWAYRTCMFDYIYGSNISGTFNVLNLKNINYTTINATAVGIIERAAYSQIIGGVPVVNIPSLNYTRFYSSKNQEYPIEIDAWGLKYFANTPPNNADFSKYDDLFSTTNTTGGRAGRIRVNYLNGNKAFWQYYDDAGELKEIVLEPDPYKVLKA